MVEKVFEIPHPSDSSPYRNVVRKMHGMSVDAMIFELESLSDEDKRAMNEVFRELSGSRSSCRHLGVDYDKLGDDANPVFLKYAAHIISKEQGVKPKPLPAFKYDSLLDLGDKVKVAFREFRTSLDLRRRSLKSGYSVYEELVGFNRDFQGSLPQDFDSVLGAEKTGVYPSKVLDCLSAAVLRKYHSGDDSTRYYDRKLPNSIDKLASKYIKKYHVFNAVYEKFRKSS